MKKLYAIMLTATTICSFISTHTGQKRSRQTSSPATHSKRACLDQKTLNENLVEAVRHGCLRDAVSFLEKGADANATFPSPHVPSITIPLVVLAATNLEKNIAIAMISLLHQHGANLHAKHPTHGTALHMAAKQGKVEIIRLLLQLGAERNHPFDSAKESPLHGAARAGNVAAMQALVRGLSSEQQKKLLQQKGCDGWTPIHCAADAAQYNALAWLCKQEIDSAPVDDRGNTPLHLLAVGAWLPHLVTNSRSEDDYRQSFLVLQDSYQTSLCGSHSIFFQPNDDYLLPEHIAARCSVALTRIFFFYNAVNRLAQTPLGDTLYSVANSEVRAELGKDNPEPTNKWTKLMREAKAITQLDEASKKRLRTAVAEEQHPTHVTSTFDSALSVAGCEQVKQFIREQIRTKVRDVIATHTFDKNVSEIILGLAGGYNLQPFKPYIDL